MPQTSHPAERYSLIEDHGSNDKFDVEDLPFEYSNRPTRRRLSTCWKSCAALFCLVAAFAAGTQISGAAFWQSGVSLEKHQAPSSCKDPPTRREWRSLSKIEKSNYIAAVQCLRDSHSKIGVEQTMYDDFPWVHSRFGEYSHGTAAFLSWHRYFLHTYEKTLQEQCNYKGHLAYWDWSLDWEDMTKAPVWDMELGFGGDGNASDVESVAYGHCVTDGPFGRLELMNYGQETKPHCLSRGFLDDANARGELGKAVGPEALEGLLRKDDYSEFNLGLEMGAHNSVPFVVRGDFYKFTAPNDPVFYLHHAQLDRMWWRWQQLTPQRRMTAYNGKVGDKKGEATREASLTDFLSVGSLGQLIRVGDVMSTETNLLCYRY